jgi:hypothetical protein
MTLQELYDYLRVRYPEHFPDDGFDDKAEGKAGYGGGWRVFHPPHSSWLLTWVEHCQTCVVGEQMVQEAVSNGCGREIR